jgi:hypothetical protein
MPVIQLFYRAFLTEFFSDPRISTAGFRKYAIKRRGLRVGLLPSIPPNEDRGQLPTSDVCLSPMITTVGVIIMLA